MKTQALCICCNQILFYLFLGTDEGIDERVYVCLCACMCKTLNMLFSIYILHTITGIIQYICLQKWIIHWLKSLTMKCIPRENICNLNSVAKLT